MLTVAEVTTPECSAEMLTSTQAAWDTCFPHMYVMHMYPCAFEVQGKESQQGGSLQVKALALQAHQCEPEFQQGTDSTESFFDSTVQLDDRNWCWYFSLRSGFPAAEVWVPECSCDCGSLHPPLLTLPHLGTFTNFRNNIMNVFALWPSRPFDCRHS